MDDDSAGIPGDVKPFFDAVRDAVSGGSPFFAGIVDVVYADGQRKSTKEQLSSLVELCLQQKFIRADMKSSLEAAFKKHDLCRYSMMCCDRDMDVIVKKQRTIVVKSKGLEGELKEIERLSSSDGVEFGVEYCTAMIGTYDTVLARQKALIDSLHQKYLDAAGREDHGMMGQQSQDGIDPLILDQAYSHDVILAFNGGGLPARVAKIIANSKRRLTQEKLCALIGTFLDSSQVSPAIKDALKGVFERYDPVEYGKYSMKSLKADMQGKMDKVVEDTQIIVDQVRRIHCYLSMTPEGGVEAETLRAKIISDVGPVLDEIIQTQEKWDKDIDARLYCLRRDIANQVAERQMEGDFRSYSDGSQDPDSASSLSQGSPP